MNKKLLLIDGNYLMFQSFYATYRGDVSTIMRSSQGVPTNAINTFLVQMIKLIKEYQPKYLFIAFDAKEKTNRHEVFQDYKANRTKAPNELFIQFDLIKTILNQLGIQQREIPRAEADDLIATATARFDKIEKLIFSRDKDLLQLVNKSTSIINKDTNGYSLTTDDNFYDTYQIYPSQIVDFKGLKGDPSDNLPGIKGIGDITAIKLLNEFGSFDNIYANINSPKITKSVKTKLENGYHDGKLCFDLAKLNSSVEDFNFQLEDLEFKINLDKAQDLLQKLELNTVLKYFKVL